MTPLDENDTEPSRFLRLAPPLTLCGAWIAMALVINPEGDFPLNDDWAFGLPVEVFVREGNIYFNYNQAMTLIGQVLWGTLFCLPAGFSFTALRISTLALGLVGVLSLYALLLRAGARRSLALAGAATLAVNPIYLGLSYTFMTDVPFLATFAAGLLFVVHGLDRNRTAPLLAGLALAWVSMFIRQLGLAIFLGLALASLIKWGFGRRWLLLGLLPVAFAGLSLAAYPAALRAMGRLPRLYGSKSGEMGLLLNDLLHLRPGALEWTLAGAFVTSMYVGLFTLPYLALLWPSALRSLPRRARGPVVAGTVTVAAAVTAALAATGRLMPLTENVLVDFGLGIRSLAGAGPPGAPRAFWLAFTAASALGATGLALTLIGAAWATWRLWDRLSPGALPPWLMALLAAIALLYCAPVITMYQILFDRYLLIPLCIAVVAATGAAGPDIRPGPFAWAVFGLITAAWAGFSVGSTHDLLDWNRTRWAACDDLVRREGVPPEAIDGGFEFNNLIPNRRLIKSGGTGDLIKRPDALYVVAKGPVKGYETFRVSACHPWLPYAIPQILVLERIHPGRSRPSLPAVSEPTGRP